MINKTYFHLFESVKISKNIRNLLLEMFLIVLKQNISWSQTIIFFKLFWNISWMNVEIFF